MTQKNPDSTVPSTGMRGGLGRTLLIAFLLLSIFPQSLISFIAATQSRSSLQRELIEKLTAVSDLKADQIGAWVSNQQLIVNIVSDQISAHSCLETDTDTGTDISTCLRDDLRGAVDQNPAFAALLLLDSQAQVLVSYPPLFEGRGFLDFVASRASQTDRHISFLERDQSALFATEMELSGWSAAVTSRQIDDYVLITILDLRPLVQIASAVTGLGENGEAYLIRSMEHVLTREALESDEPVSRHSTAIEAALSGQTGSGIYQNYRDVAVVGVYRWLPEIGLALLVEEPQAKALADIDGLAALLIGTALGAALLTTLIAAAITRRITRPIVQLTETAVQIAAGDLEQKVPATRQDEIGILARAFNVMTTKLKLLYDSLEYQVAERTRQLREANAEVRYRAMQLAISAEVARVVTSILDQDILIPQVVDLIRDCFQAYYVSLFSIDESAGDQGETWAVLREGTGGLGSKLKARGYRVRIDEKSLVGQAVSYREPRIGVGAELDHLTDRDIFPYTQSELSVPLKVGQRITGVLDVHSTQDDTFTQDEMIVLETLAGQVAVAIENARAYQIERQAAEELRRLEQLRRRFLANMSRELRTPLNNIIGFSRVILKGIDGPITDLQREDLKVIHSSGRQLLALINDILDIAQIEAGLMELSFRQVDLDDLIQSILPTANALLSGKNIELTVEMNEGLPTIVADAYRVRQVLLKLLSNAAKFTDEGEVSIRAWPDGDFVMISVSDTGMGISPEDRDKIFDQFGALEITNGGTIQGAGLGLVLSKEFIGMHGGQIQIESVEGAGSTFTVVLPRRPNERA